MSTRRAPRRERGSVMVEMVGILPVFVILMFFIVHGVAVVAAVDATNQAARNAARALSLQDPPHAAAAAAIPSWAQLRSVDAGGCAEACASVTTGVPIGVPGVLVVTHVEITRDAVFARHD